MSTRTAPLVVLALAGACPAQLRQLDFDDATADAGLDAITASRVCLADLDADHRPDAVLDRRRVFLNTPDEDAPRGFRFVEVEETGLPEPGRGDCLVFADLDNDGHADAVLTRYLDVNADGYEPPETGPASTAWMPGHGDGTFGKPREIDAAEARTTACIAIGDADRDGRLDLYLGNWYEKYGGGYAGFPNDLLLQTEPGRFVRDAMPTDGVAFDDEADPGGRPTYGVMMLDLGLRCEGPGLLDLNYGRRWNRLWCRRPEGLVDRAPALGLDGDDIRHGRHPDWLKERARTDPRFDRDDEKPFRANGNTFDAAVGDVDNDGDFDLFLATIAHGWAGRSSDRSRFLFQQTGPAGTPRFIESPAHSVDRAPTDPTIKSWNQGDLFCALADLDCDGRLDLLLSSGDYPDDQRLRCYRQQENGTFADVTPWVGLANDGSQQLSLGDVDLDGDLDLLVGQSFNRMGKALRAGRTPAAKLYLNQAAERGLGRSLSLRLVGDPELGVARDALGAVVRVTTREGGSPVTRSRQLVGVGGHAGKQHDPMVHVGLAGADDAERVEIRWPDAAGTTTVLEGVPAGRHTVRLTPDGTAISTP